MNKFFRVLNKQTIDNLYYFEFKVLHEDRIYPRGGGWDFYQPKSHVI